MPNRKCRALSVGLPPAAALTLASSWRTGFSQAVQEFTYAPRAQKCKQLQLKHAGDLVAYGQRFKIDVTGLTAPAPQ